MKKVNWMSLVDNVLLAILLATALKVALGWNPIIVTLAILLLGMLVRNPKGVLLDGLQKEVWTNQLIETLHRPTDFWMDGSDWSEFVENDKINFAIEGGEPGAEINRTTYPIPVEELGETPGDVELDEFSTNTTVVKDAEIVELSYEKMESVLRRHRRKIRKDYAHKGFWGITPNADASDTPFIQNTGAQRAGSGVKSLTEADILELGEKCDSLDWDADNRVLRLIDQHFWDIIANSEILRKQWERQSTGKIGGDPLNIHGFEIKRVPNYCRAYVYDNAGTLERRAFGVAPTPGTDFPASLAYVKNDTFCYADGTTKMYNEVDNVDYQGTLVNFRHRGLVRLKQQARVAALVSLTA